MTLNEPITAERARQALNLALKTVRLARAELHLARLRLKKAEADYQTVALAAESFGVAP